MNITYICTCGDHTEAKHMEVDVCRHHEWHAYEVCPELASDYIYTLATTYTIQDRECDADQRVIIITK